jgi:23S rRNA (cytosine1962-C5)-methyltransferase
MGMIQVRVKPGVEEKLKAYFPWVYRPEIVSYSRKPQKGEQVIVRDAGGHFLGYGYINPQVSISIRLLSFNKDKKISQQLIKERIQQAYNYRKKLSLDTDAYRLVHSEGDFLPGLVVDVYDQYVGLEFTTFGMNLMRDWVISAIIDTLKPQGIYEKRNDYAQSIEGFETQEGVIYGEMPKEVIIREGDLRYYVNIPEGQKTGFYLDQRYARSIVRQLVKPGQTCLDLFCHTGGFALNMRKAGAQKVIAVDISSQALEFGKRNAKLNGIDGIEWIEANAFDFMRKLHAEGQTFDFVLMDPPSFAKNKASLPNALRGYKELLVRGLHITKRGGLLVVYSCSFHITLDHLFQVLIDAAKDVKRHIRVLKVSFQDLDHPWILQVPNSLYLKGVYVEVL